MKKMLVRFFLFSSALVLSGCAYYTNVSPIKIDSNILDNPLIQPSPSPYATNQIRGSIGVGYTPYVDPLAIVAGAIAGGVASGDSNTGIMFMAAGVGDQQEKKGAPSPFGSGVAIDIPRIYLDDVIARRGVIAENLQAAQVEGIVLKPTVNLIYDKTGNVDLTCTLDTESYVKQARNWKFRYIFIKYYQWDGKSSQHIDASVFLSETVKCFEALDRTFRAHVSGNLDNSFKKGQLMYASDFGFKGMFYKDDVRRVYLRYTTDFLEISPMARAYSFQYNE